MIIDKRVHCKDFKGNMAIIQLNYQNFEETVNQQQVSVIYFYANWSENCQQFDNIFSKISDEFTDVNFGSVDAEKELELIQAFGVNSVPTLMVFREGILLYGRPGMADDVTLIQLIHTKRKLNMNEIHEKIASQENN